MVYDCAADEMPDPVVSEMVEVNDRTVAVFRYPEDGDPALANQTLDGFSEWCRRVEVNPLCIFVAGDDMGLEFLDEVAMNAAGWYRKDEPAKTDVCTCHERDSSYVCDYCYSQGYRGHMQK